MDDNIRQYYNSLINFDALSSEDKNDFLITRGLQSRHYNDIVRIWKNVRFREEFGDRSDYDQLTLLPPSQRDIMLQQNAVNKTREKFFTKKQIGADKANKIMGLTPQGFDDLINSDWDPNDYIDSYDITSMAEIGAGIGAATGGILAGLFGSAAGPIGTAAGVTAGIYSGSKVGTAIGAGVGLVGKGIESFWNRDTDSELNEVVAKDNERKSKISSEILPQVSGLLNTVIDGSAFRDIKTQQEAAPILQVLNNYGVDISKGEASNIDTLFEKVVGSSTPYWEMFKDRHELSDITKGDKVSMVQKTIATDLTFQDGGYSSMSINNQNIQNHVSNNQSWDDWAFNTGKNVVVGTVGALGETIAGTAALGAYVLDKTNALIGNRTNYTKNILEGVDEDGNEMPLLLNLAYFDGVDKFNTFDNELIKKIRENGGISPYNNVALAGEEGKFFSWQSLNEAIKMSKYFAATKITSKILGSLSNKAANLSSDAMRKLGASATKSETVGTFVNKFGSMGTYLAAGVPVSAGYGLGAYEDTKLNLTEKEDERQAQELFDNYLKTDEYQNRVSEIEKQLFISKRGDGSVHNLYTKEGARKAAESYVQSEMKNYFLDFVKDNREALANSNSSYKENRDNIDRIAVDAYALDATIEGAKNTFVNLNFRNYLFNKSTTEMLKGGKDATTPVRFNPKTGKIEQVSKGIRGEDVPSNVKIDIARAVGKQLWGGFISNYTDDITTGFVEAGAEKRYDNYLKQRYNGKAIGSVANFFRNLYDVANASLQGAEAKASDPISWYDGFIGALGSVTPGSGGLPSLSPYNTSSPKRSFKSKLTEALVRTTGIGATAYDTYYKNRNTRETVNIVNGILEDRKLDLLDLIDFASSTNTFDISSENGSIRDAKTDKAKALLSTLLYLDRNRDNPVVTAAPQLQEILRALDIMRDEDRMNSSEGESLINKLATQFLQQSQNKDIASLPKERAMSIATSRVSKRLEKARKLINSMDEVSAEYRMQNRKASPDAVGQMVTLKVMAGQYKERINEMEKELGLPIGSSISGSLSIESIIARYPTRKLAKERLAVLEAYEKHIKQQQQKEIAEGKKAKEFKARAKQRADALARMLDEISMEKELVQKALEQYFSDSETSSRTLSKEEILALDPSSRAAMLNFDESSDHYSFKQRHIIREILKEYTEKGINNAGELFFDVAQLKNLHDNNLEVYSDNIKHPEVLEKNIADKVELFNKVANNVRLDMQSSTIKQYIDEYIKILTTNGVPQSEMSNYISRLLRQLAPIDVIKYMQGKEEFSNLFKELKQAEEFINLINDVDDVIQGIELEDNVKRNFISNISNIIDRANAKEDILDEIGKIVESNDAEVSDKAPYENLLNELEQLWNQRASTTTMTREERIAAQEEYQKKLAEEAQRKKDAEEAAKAEAERKAAEAANTDVTSIDTDASNDRDAELAAQGLTDKDTKTDNESTLTSEQVAKAVEEGEDVDIESPTLEKQASETPDKVNIIPAPKDDSTDQGNILPSSDGALLGNSMYRYDINSLKYHGKQVARKGKDAKGVPDKMSRYFQWMESAGIKLQEIIDEELGEIAKLNPDIYPMFVKVEKNATNDDAMADFPLLVIEYTADIANIHNDKNGGILTSGGKQYLVIGTLGFPDGTGRGVQGDMIRKILNESPRKPFFDANPSERFYVNRNMHTQIRDISSGRLVRQLTTDAEVQIRKISELLSDEARNPKGLTIGDLKWYIRQGDKIATVNVSDRNTIYPDRDGLGNKGATFLLIETANGNYIPAYIRPVRVSELNDGKLSTLIDSLFKKLMSTKFSDRKEAVDKLKTLLVLKEEENDINPGTDKKPKVSIIQNGFIRTFDLSDPNVNIFGQGGLLETLRSVDFRVNITTSTLSNVSSLEMFDEAGALTTDLAKLGTSNASYNVYAIDPDGNPIITAPIENQAPTLEAGSDLAKAQKKMSSERMSNATYRKGADGNWHTETDKLVTDPRLIEQLNYKNLIRTRGLKPNKVIGMDEIFVINSDKDNPFVLVRRRGNQIFAMSKEGAIKTINEVNAELAEKARQERLQKELEKEASDDETLRAMSGEERQRVATEGEDVDLGLGETLTEDQIVEQMTGNFKAEATPQQRTAEELVDRITSDTADIHLSDDGATYVDADGKHYARVTSVIAADEFSDGRFEADNPWGLPSTTIGTGIDEFVRDFFDNKLGNMENLADRYPNASNEQLQAFAKQLEELRNDFKRRGLTIVPRGVTVTGTVEVKTNSSDRTVIDVAGTLDLLAYDKDGNFYIFDMKTNRSVPRGESGRKKGAKWSKQLTLYKQLLQEKYGAVVKGLEIIPIQVDYPAPKGWGNATTEYTKSGGQLYANGEEYRMAEPILHDNIPLPETALHIDYSKLIPAEQAMVRTLEDVAPTRDKGAPVVQSEPVRTGEDINKTGTKSLAELQSKKTVDTALSIMKSKKFGKRARALLKAKFPDMPSNIAELDGFLQSKGIVTTGITDVEQWLNMIEECK